MALEFNSRFTAELEKAKNIPAILLGLGTGLLENQQTTAIDWGNNSSESNVDYATIPGSVTLDPISMTDTISQSANTDTYSQAGLDGDTLYQTISQTQGDDLKLKKVAIKYLQYGDPKNITVEIRSTSKSGSTVAGPISENLNSGDKYYEFDFDDDDFIMSNGTTYYLVLGIHDIGGIGVSDPYYTDDSGAYAGGNLYEYSTDNLLGDLTMTLYFTSPWYLSSGSIETQNMGLSEIPSAPGEWIIYDNKNGETITYSAEGSATGAWGGEEVSLGAIVDGDEITDYYKYYRVTASLSTSDRSVSPEIQEITASFVSYTKFSDHAYLGYQPSIQKISSLTTKISDFDNASIGQMSVTLSRTDEVETYLLSGSVYPRNKPAYIRFGFVPKPGDDDFGEESYETFYSGVVDNYVVNADDTITIALRDITNKFTIKIPPSTSTPPPSSLVYSADHPIDVVLDILQNQLEIRDSFIDADAFDSVETDLSGWLVTRTITADQESAKTLLEELRQLMSCYLIPKASGKISIKQWDAAESALDTWSDSGDFVAGSIEWDRNSKSQINQQITYYDWAGTGDDYSDFNEVTATLDATSQSNYDEIKENIRTDKWTAAAQSSQISTYNNAVIARYADPPGILKGATSIKKLKYEVGDIIAITSARPIGSALGGLTSENFQIVKKNLDWQNLKLKFELLQVAG